MTAAAKNTQRQIANQTRFDIAVKNAATLYAGCQMAGGGPDHGTAANQGKATAWTSAAGEVPLGLATGQVAAGGLLGNSAATVMATALADGGILEKVAVTGASAISDKFKPVYWTDDNTLSLTRPTLGIPAGLVVEWYSSTTCDVFLYPFATMCALGLGGAGQDLVFLGSIDFANTADGDIRTGIPMSYHGKILTVFAMVAVAYTGSGGTALLNLEIDGTNVTGGVVTTSTAAGGTLGTKLSGTAVTAANVFREGSVIDVEASSSGGTRTTGRCDLYMEVEKLVGL